MPASTSPSRPPRRLPLGLVAALLLALPLALCRPAQAAPAPARPAITGIAHFAVYTSSMAAADHFYGHILGFEQAFHFNKPSGALQSAWFKVNRHQYIVVIPGLPSPNASRLVDIAFQTSNVRQLRAYLIARGVQVSNPVRRARDGSLTLRLTDPEGHHIEFVQYTPGSLENRDAGKFLGPHRVSRSFLHCGFVVRHRAAENHFYHEILGFQETWHGGMTDTRTDWVDMRVPNGTEWLEFMITRGPISVKTRGVLNHVSLLEPHIHQAAKLVAAHGYTGASPKIGRDGKWQENLYDPDFTRIEMMGPHPVEKPCCSAFHNLTPAK